MKAANWQRHKISRRGLLRAAAGATVGGAAVAVAACSDGGNGSAATATLSTGQDSSIVGPVEQQRQRRLGTGLTGYDPTKTFDGYTLFAPFGGTEAYLVDMMGEVVNTWTLSDDATQASVFGVSLLENGNLFATLHHAAGDAPPFVFKGGIIREVDWDGNTVWELSDEDQHHDARLLPNGNILSLRAEVLSPEFEAQIPGGLPAAQDFGMWTDYVAEVTRDGDTVWEWHAKDHLDPAAYEINATDARDEWTHANSIEQLPDGNVLISFRNINLVAIIDRESGDLTWTMGVPELAQQHHPSMLPNGNVLIFDNGGHRENSSLHYSRVIEVDITTNEIVWEYIDKSILNFFSPFISSAQRLTNGNTFISEGNYGRLFEITSDGEIVWEYISPFFVLNGFLGEVNMVFRAFRYPTDAFQMSG